MGLRRFAPTQTRLWADRSHVTSRPGSLLCTAPAFAPSGAICGGIRISDGIAVLHSRHITSLDRGRANRGNIVRRDNPPAADSRGWGQEAALEQPADAPNVAAKLPRNFAQCDPWSRRYRRHAFALKE
jgi:hypothetical protein